MSQPRRPTPEDLAVLPTRGEVEYDLPTVTWPDGSPVTLRLRALDARAQADIDRSAMSVGQKHGIDYDYQTALVLTVFHGIAEPRLEEGHQSILWGWGTFVLEGIAEHITQIGRLPARNLQATLERLAGIPVPDPPAPQKRSRRARNPR